MSCYSDIRRNVFCQRHHRDRDAICHFVSIETYPSLSLHILYFSISWSLLFGLLPPALLGVGLLYEPFSFLDPLFLLASLRFLHWYVGILLALQSNGALVVVSYCRVVLYTHVFGDRQFVPLRPHYPLASVVHKSIRVFHTPICANS